MDGFPAPDYTTRGSARTARCGRRRGVEFFARAELIAAGTVLRGSARYEGFALKFELQRRE
ncbi:MAG TPA: hypothetical protein VNM24_07625 [Burkholderiales bacterium]|nr:hypothetical protein [Burkholderiales bacterium]